MEYMDKISKKISFNEDKPLKEILYECLKDNIIKGVIPVGQRIVEKSLADKLNISRTPVREALKRLEQEEIVEYVHGKGIIVKNITEEEVVEIYKIRKNLEVLAAVNAMENISKEEIENIERLLDLTEEKNKQGDIKEVIRLFAKFNQKIYEASRMKRLTSMITKLKEYHERFRDISMAENSRREKGLIEHREILKAIGEKDYERIEDMISRHLDKSMCLVLKELREQKKILSADKNDKENVKNGI